MPSIDALLAQLDPDALAARAETAPRLIDEVGVYSGECWGHFKPRSVEQVQTIVHFARANGLVIVPQGGNTSSCGGATPTQPNTILLSFERMAAIEAINPIDRSIIVEAGAVLSDVQSAAASGGMYFPLSLGAQNSCTIGGNVATNAGGIHVMRYGSMRALVRGLEVVLADGSIVSSLPWLKKDNTGYDLTNLFIGSEGTLGVITRVGLQLHPALHTKVIGVFGVATPTEVMALYDLMTTHAGNAIEMFEVMPHTLVAGATPHLATHPWLVLVELATANHGDRGDRCDRGDQSDRGDRCDRGDQSDRGARGDRGDAPSVAEGAAIGGDPAEDAEFERLMQVFESVYHAAESAGIVAHCSVATNQRQASEMRATREKIVGVQRQLGASLKHDIAVPLRAIPAFIESANAAARALIPECVPLPFGHVGDGNLHYNIAQPPAMAAA
ncbi:MAG: FAD-binding oxidoreductase, partial [Alphaproteobacteria bacterium]|nr:FAD-binding oxidoreductase [Alphaproteobacteria bacterium]